MSKNEIEKKSTFLKNKNLKKIYWSQIKLIFKTRDPDNETKLPHRMQTQKITKKNYQSSKIKKQNK